MTPSSRPRDGRHALDPEPRIDAILDWAPEPTEYRAWLAEQRRDTGSPRDYLFTRDVPRFEPRRGDVPIPGPESRIEERAGVPLLVTAAEPSGIALAGVAPAEAHRIFDAMDGERCLLEVQWAAEVDGSAIARFLRASFGRGVFVPAAVAELEERVPGHEISRFPSSPYGLERPYWENMAAVRERFRRRASDVGDADSLVRLLRELHVVSLLGAELDSFYKPASPGAERSAPPGALLLAVPRVKPGREHATFLSGPRANASLVGGACYHRAIAGSVADEEALLEDRSLEVDGLPWGSVTNARGESDAKAAPWFCPPRPIRREHFEWLAAALSRALAARSAAARPSHGTPPADRSPAEVVDALGRWHWGFVRLHPFHCANQSLAMNLANAILAEARGSGIPHLLLDQLALRLSLDGYQRLFARAAAHWAVTGLSASERLVRLVGMRTKLFGLLEATSRPRATLDVSRLAKRDPEQARAGLLID